MSMQYHDKFPIADQLKEMKNNQAAAEMLLSKGREDKTEKEVNPMKIMVLLICCFVMLYLVCMLLVTLLVKDDYELRYSKNLNAVAEYLASNLSEVAEERNLTGYVNSVYDLPMAEETYQNLSAAIYDKHGKILATTGSYLCLNLEDKEMCYVPLEQYFEGQEIHQLREYVKVNQPKYMNEALIDRETKTLVSFHIESVPTFGDSMTVWEWKHPKADSYDKEALIKVYEKTEVRDVISIPYYKDDASYKRWQESAFLQEFAESIDTDAKYPIETTDGNFFKTQTRIVEQISFEDASGEKVSYYVAVHAIGHQLQASMNSLSLAYIMGFVVLLISILIAISSLNKLRFRSK